MALFEGYERRIKQITPFLAKYGISSLEEAEKVCIGKGVDVRKIVKDIQPISFENAGWAYLVGAAVAIKKGQKQAADIAETRSSSLFEGSDEAMLRPSTLTIAAASISGELTCRSRRRSTSCSLRDFATASLLIERRLPHL